MLVNHLTCAGWLGKGVNSILLYQKDNPVNQSLTSEHYASIMDLIVQSLVIKNTKTDEKKLTWLDHLKITAMSGKQILPTNNIWKRRVIKIWGNKVSLRLVGTQNDSVVLNGSYNKDCKWDFFLRLKDGVKLEKEQEILLLLCQL